MGFLRQEYWSGLPFPAPGNLPNPDIKPASPTLAGGFFTTVPPGNPHCDFKFIMFDNRSIRLEWQLTNLPSPTFPSKYLLKGLPWWSGGFPGGSDSEESAHNVGDLDLISGPGRSPGEGNGNPHQYSCLENSMDREAWGAKSMMSQRVRHDWATEHTHRTAL